MLSSVGPADVRSPYKLHLHICCDKRVALSCVISQRTFPPLPGTWCSSAAVILSFQNSVGCLGRWSREFSKHIGEWEHSAYTSCCSGKWSILFIMDGPSSCNNAIYGLFFMFCRLDDRKTASNSWERSAQGLMPWCESRTPWAARGSIHARLLSLFQSMRVIAVLDGPQQHHFRDSVSIKLMHLFSISNKHVGGLTYQIPRSALSTWCYWQFL